MTIIDLYIPTHNRPKFLKRLLEYYNNYGQDFRIIIADSSNSENKKLNKKVIKLFPNLKITYTDNFPPKQISHHKFGMMLKHAKSKYSVFCADDDFLIPNAIYKSINFLDHNPDYSCAHGIYISFYTLNLPFFQNKFLWRYIYPYKSLTSKSPEDRLIDHLNEYYQVLWAVRRTAQLKIAYSEFKKSGVDGYLFGEMLPDMLSLIQGKMKKIPIFYASRQAFSTVYSYWPTLLDAKKNNTFNSEYTKFKNCLINNLPNKSSLNFQKISNKIDLAMDKYINYSYQEHLMYQIGLFLKHFPKIISNIFGISLVMYLFSKPNHSEIGNISKPKSKFYIDFDRIRQSVNNHRI